MDGILFLCICSNYLQRRWSPTQQSNKKQTITYHRPSITQQMNSTAFSSSDNYTCKLLWWRWCNSLIGNLRSLTTNELNIVISLYLFGGMHHARSLLRHHCLLVVALLIYVFLPCLLLRRRTYLFNRKLNLLLTTKVRAEQLLACARISHAELSTYDDANCFLLLCVM